MSARSGLAKRASTRADCAVEGVRARFLVGRCDFEEMEVGLDSGMFSDMVKVLAGEEVIVEAFSSAYA